MVFSRNNLTNPVITRTEKHRKDLNKYKKIIIIIKDPQKPNYYLILKKHFMAKITIIIIKLINFISYERNQPEMCFFGI